MLGFNSLSSEIRFLNVARCSLFTFLNIFIHWEKCGENFVPFPKKSDFFLKMRIFYPNGEMDKIFSAFLAVYVLRHPDSAQVDVMT